MRVHQASHLPKLHALLDELTATESEVAAARDSAHFGAMRKLVTDWLAAEQALAIERARYAALLITAPSAIIGIDSEGVVIAWNVKAEQVFGWTIAEAVGRLLADLIIPPRSRERHAAGLRRVVLDGDSKAFYRRVRTRAMRKSGEEVPIEMKIGPAPDAGVYFFFAYVTDLTEPDEPIIYLDRVDG